MCIRALLVQLTLFLITRGMIATVILVNNYKLNLSHLKDIPSP